MDPLPEEVGQGGEKQQGDSGGAALCPWAFVRGWAKGFAATVWLLGGGLADCMQEWWGGFQQLLLAD
jgi:hypothetical protein